MKKTLILMNARWEIHRYYMKMINIPDADVASAYVFTSHDKKYMLGALHMEYLNAPAQSVWYDEWKKHINEYDTFIVFRTLLNTNIVEYIHKKNPTARIILFFWDSITDTAFGVPEEYRDFCEMWSFDEDNCRKYNLKRNVQFYIPKMMKAPIKWDVLMVMRDKGRFDKIYKLHNMIKNANLTINTRIIADKTTEDNIAEKADLFGKPLEYDELISQTVSSNCIVEMVKEGQTGLTLRALEALFYNKKLITNNKAIIAEPFYDENNILVIDENTTSDDIKIFWKKEYKIIPESVKEQYTVNSWYENFGINK